MGTLEDCAKQSVECAKLEEFTARIYEVVKNAKQIKVTTPRDTKFIAEFSPKHNWAISNALDSHFGSRVFTCPVNLNGQIMVDGVLGDAFEKKYGLMYNYPLTISAKGGRVALSSCIRNNSLTREFREYLQRDENANRFGELGIGTNVYLKRITGNVLHDKNFPGVYVAIGHPSHKETGVQWDSKVYCEMIIRNCNIFVDGEQIMLTGEFNNRLTKGIFP
jgi:aminopeptidase